MDRQANTALYAVIGSFQSGKTSFINLLTKNTHIITPNLVSTYDNTYGITTQTYPTTFKFVSNYITILDTPGHSSFQFELNKLQFILNVIILIDATLPILPKFNLENKNSILIISKVDCLANKNDLDEIVNKFNAKFKQIFVYSCKLNLICEFKKYKKISVNAVHELKSLLIREYLEETPYLYFLGTYVYNKQYIQLCLSNQIISHKDVYCIKETSIKFDDLFDNSSINIESENNMNIESKTIINTENNTNQLIIEEIYFFNKKITNSLKNIPFTINQSHYSGTMFKFKTLKLEIYQNIFLYKMTIKELRNIKLIEKKYLYLKDLNTFFGSSNLYFDVLIAELEEVSGERIKIISTGVINWVKKCKLDAPIKSINEGSILQDSALFTFKPINLFNQLIYSANANYYLKLIYKEITKSNRININILNSNANLEENNLFNNLISTDMFKNDKENNIFDLINSSDEKLIFNLFNSTGLELSIYYSELINTFKSIISSFYFPTPINIHLIYLKMNNFYTNTPMHSLSQLISNSVELILIKVKITVIYENIYEKIIEKYFNNLMFIDSFLEYKLGWTIINLNEIEEIERIVYEETLGRAIIIRNSYLVE